MQQEYIGEIIRQSPATLTFFHVLICFDQYLLDHFHPHLQSPRLMKAFKVETSQVYAIYSCCIFCSFFSFMN